MITDDQVPIELVMAGRELTEPRPSPDGQRVAFVQRWGARAAVMVVAIDGGPERAFTTSPDPSPGRGMGGGCFDWLPDGSGIVYVASDGELWLQPAIGPPRSVTRFARSCAAPVIAPSGEFVVVVVDEAEVWRLPLGPLDPDAADAEPLPPAAGDRAGRADRARRLDDGLDQFCFDPAIAPGSGEVCWLGWSPPDMPWDGAHVCRVDVAGGAVSPPRRWRPSGGAVQQPRYTQAGGHSCVHDASGWLNVHVDDAPVLPEPREHAGPTWGMGQRSYAVSPDGEAVAICRNEDGFGRLTITRVGANSQRTVIDLGRGVHGQVGWVGGSIVALRSGARTPTQIVRYDATTHARSVLAVGPAAGWDELDLPEPELFQLALDERTGRGVTLHARRYAANTGRLLVWVHGGPTDQWPVDFRPRIAYWWSRGWDVLVVDPRGTTGHGRAYQRALNGAWGRLDVDDTAALIRAAHSRGWSTAAATVVIGGSSGGLTVLGLLADHPELVAGGVASYPVSDLRALTAGTHRFEAHYTDTLVGPPAEFPERYDELSPVNRAERIVAPLLLFHGTDDPVVPVTQSDELAARIVAAGGRVDYVVYDAEGHGFRDPINQRDEYDRTERFLTAVVRPER